MSRPPLTSGSKVGGERSSANTRDKLRYEYEHSILGYDESEWDSKPLGWGHRLSMMIRVRFPSREWVIRLTAGCALSPAQVNA